MRSERLGDIDNEFYLYAETNMQAVRSQVEAIKPDFLIIDSIQTIMSPEISAFKVLYLRFVKSLLNLCRLPKPITLPHLLLGM